MFVYEKKLQYPVNIKNTNPNLSALFISQYGGPDGELGASLRYLSQRYAMPNAQLAGILTDIGTEELAHLEMVGSRQLYLEHHTGILAYSEEQIDANTTAGVLRVRGQRLTLLAMTGEELRIGGRIDAVEWVR